MNIYIIFIELIVHYIKFINKMKNKVSDTLQHMAKIDYQKSLPLHSLTIYNKNINRFAKNNYYKFLDHRSISPKKQIKPHHQNLNSNPKRSISTAAPNKTYELFQSRQLRIVTRQQPQRYSKFKKSRQNPLYQARISAKQNNQYDLKFLDKLLQSCDLEKMRQKKYEILFNTYGLKIQSLKHQVQQKKHKTIISPTRDLDQMVRQKKQRRRVFDLDRPLNQTLNFNTIKLEKIQLDRSNEKIHQIQQSHYKRMQVYKEKDYFKERLHRYKQYLFLINLSNRIYRDLDFQNYQAPIKIYIGKGNNSNLIRSIIKKRFWYQEVEQMQSANLVWTQIKCEQLFKNQTMAAQHQFQQNIFLDFGSQQKSNDLIKKGTKQFQPKHQLLKLLNKQDFLIYNKFLQKQNRSKKSKFQPKLKLIDLKVKISKNIHKQRIHNHLPTNGLLGNKKALFYCLKQYCKLTNQQLFKIVPYTVHIKQGLQDPEFIQFLNTYNTRANSKKYNSWVLKPGQFTNRGKGITCTNDIKIINQLISKQNNHTYIIQQYIHKPMLYHGRKFDIRAYMLITNINGIMKGYWYQDGYIRTSSYRFDIGKFNDPMIHLTNDAVQKNCDDYGKYQQSNKLSYNDLQRYLLLNYRLDFFMVAYPEIKRIAIQTIKSTILFLDTNRREHNFQIFGLDFMLDQHLKPWLIEVNTNPCLQVNCGVLSRIIPSMVENAFKITVDTAFPPPNIFPASQRYYISQNSLLYNKFQLVFDSLSDSKQLKQLYKDSKIKQQYGNIAQDKLTYQNEGQQQILTNFKYQQ